MYAESVFDKVRYVDKAHITHGLECQNEVTGFYSKCDRKLKEDQMPHLL